MKKRVIIFVVIAVIAGVILIMQLTKKEEPITLETTKVERADIATTVTATGTIEANKTVNVGTQVSGIIQHIYVDFNDNVRQGQILAKLDETPLKAQLDQSQASLDQAQAQLNYQESTFKRMKVLYDKNLIAQTDYDQSLYNYENSKAILSNARSALSKAKVNLDYATIVSPIDGVVLNRAIEEGQTVAASFNTPTLFTIVNDLTQMEVRTSVDEADIGQVIQGQKVGFTVDAYPDLKFSGTVSQVRLQPVTTNNVVTYVVILSAPNPDKKLMPGMTASATIYTKSKTNVLVLSEKAIRFTPEEEFMKTLDVKTKGKMRYISETADSNIKDGTKTILPDLSENIQTASSAAPERTQDYSLNNVRKASVWIKSTDGKIYKKAVLIGLDNGNTVEILSGLKEGDELITSIDNGIVKPTIQRGGPMGF